MNFAARIEPLNEMLRKDVPIVATERRLKAFSYLKCALTHAPVLGIYRSDCDIIIDVDTSSTSCGAVCSQFRTVQPGFQSMHQDACQNLNETCAPTVES